MTMEIPFPIRLLGSFTLDPLAQALGRAGARRVEQAPYAQFRQALADPAAAAGGVDVLVTDLDAWVPGGAHGLMGIDPGARRAAREALAREAAAFAEAASRKGRRLVMATLPLPARPLLGYADWHVEEGELAWLQAANAALASALRPFPSARVWDLAALRAAFGVSRAEDPRLRCLGDIRMSPDFTTVAAADLLRLLRTFSTPPRKVLVLDLDGTLWGGLAGEEGLGVAVGKEDPVGRAFLSFQEEVLALKARGVLLAVASKNDEAAALEVIDRHPGMLIRRKDLAAWRINWEDKAAGLKALAAELNLGLDAFAFWDDQPFEREWVRRACPEVAVAEVPEDPARFAGYLRAWDAFDAAVLTEEDRARSSQYSAERERRELRAGSGSLEDYLASLGTRVRITRAAPEDRTRLVQLFQKTNQFNLTTRRLDEAEVGALAAEGRVLVMRLSDRFGEQGLVGAAVLEPGTGAWRITDFLMSCRVLGREAETALLSACLREAWQAGARSVIGEVVPTPKNGMAGDFYRRCGFKPDPSSNGIFRFRVDAPGGPDCPPWIMREEVADGP